MLTISLLVAACRPSPAPAPEPAQPAAPQPSTMRFETLGGQSVVLPDPGGKPVVVEMVRSIDW